MQQKLSGFSLRVATAAPRELEIPGGFFVFLRQNKRHRKSRFRIRGLEFLSVSCQLLAKQKGSSNEKVH
jgi:hypothetical protein